MKEYVEVPAQIPTSLIIYPCEPVGVGETVGSLAKAYVDNTVCIGRYKGVVRGLEEWNDSVKEVSGD